jgi:hypothetical protein
MQGNTVVFAKILAKKRGCGRTLAHPDGEHPLEERLLAVPAGDVTELALG